LLETLFGASGEDGERVCKRRVSSRPRGLQPCKKIKKIEQSPIVPLNSTDIGLCKSTNGTSVISWKLHNTNPKPVSQPVAYLVQVIKTLMTNGLNSMQSPFLPASVQRLAEEWGLGASSGSALKLHPEVDSLLRMLDKQGHVMTVDVLTQLKNDLALLWLERCSLVGRLQKCTLSLVSHFSRVL